MDGSRADRGGMLVAAIATTCGAGLIIGVHVLNLRFSKRCRCCEPGMTVGRLFKLRTRF